MIGVSRVRSNYTKALDLGYMVGKELEVFIFESGTRFKVSNLKGLRYLDLCITVYTIDRWTLRWTPRPLT